MVLTCPKAQQFLQRARQMGLCHPCSGMVIFLVLAGSIGRPGHVGSDRSQPCADAIDIQFLLRHQATALRNVCQGRSRAICFMNLHLDECFRLLGTCAVGNSPRRAPRAAFCRPDAHGSRYPSSAFLLFFMPPVQFSCPW